MSEGTPGPPWTEEMERLEANLSPVGRELLGEIVSRGEAELGADLSPEEVLAPLLPRFRDLPEQDLELIVRWAQAGEREAAAGVRKAKEGGAYAHAAVDAIYRAQDLEILDGKDPTSEAIKGMTLYQAVEILERRGEELPPGLLSPRRPQGTRRSQGDGWTISGYLRSTSER